MGTKKEKKIRYVKTTSKYYWVYDMDEDEFGKRKRIYGKTKEEVENRIKKLEEEKQLKIYYERPRTNKLQDYVIFYLKNALGKLSAKETRKKLALAKHIIFDSIIDTDINELTTELVNEYYRRINEMFYYENVVEVDGILRATIKLTNDLGVSDFDYSVIETPSKNSNLRFYADYIPTEEELNDLFDYCISDNFSFYKNNELIILFALYTSLKINSIRKLLVSSLDLERGFIKVDGVDFPLSDEVVKWLKTMIAEERIDLSDKNTLLFYKGKVEAINNISNTIVGMSKQCGLPKGITTKSLHKACILRELNKGVSPQKICQLYNYKQIELNSIKEEFNVFNSLYKKK